MRILKGTLTKMLREADSAPEPVPVEVAPPQAPRIAAGELRVAPINGVLHVLGQGLCYSVDSRAEGEADIRELLAAEPDLPVEEVARG